MIKLQKAGLVIKVRGGVLAPSAGMLRPMDAETMLANVADLHRLCESLPSRQFLRTAVLLLPAGPVTRAALALRPPGPVTVPPATRPPLGPFTAPPLAEPP